MDKETKINVKLGLFVAIGILIFIVGIFFIGARNGMFSKAFNVKTYFADASGLKEGGNVRYDGVKVGIVKKVILINDSTVEVDLQIDESKHEFITKSAITSISSDGLMGDKLVNVTSGKPNSPMAENGDILKSKEAVNTDKIISKLTVTNDNIGVISENLKNITSDLNTKKGAVQSLYKDTTLAIELRKTFKNLNTMSVDVLTAGENVKMMTAKMQSGKGSISQILNDTTMGRNLARTISKLKETSDKLNSASDAINTTMRQVNSGQGPVHMLLTDSATANNIRQSMSNLKKASYTLNQDLEGLQHSFLLKGYFKKKDKTQ
jgi:phospholipid/cholesterol/gamma-HCH transport system substrate-binding protein